jgi:hypothetical protein
MPEYEKTHAEAKAQWIRLLKDDPGVAMLVPDRVFDGDDPDQADEAAGHLRCVIVTEGRRYNPPGSNASGRLLCQRDVKVLIRAESERMLQMVCLAVQQLNGVTATEGFKQAVLHATNHVEEKDIGGHTAYERADFYGLHCVMPKDEDEVKRLAALRPPPRVENITKIPPRANVPRKRKTKDAAAEPGGSASVDAASAAADAAAADAGG